MQDGLDFIFRPIPRFMSYWEAAHEWGKFDLHDVRLMHHAMDVESENLSRHNQAARDKNGR